MLLLWWHYFYRTLEKEASRRIPFHFVPLGREFTKRLEEDCLSDTDSTFEIVHYVRFPRLHGPSWEMEAATVMTSDWNDPQLQKGWRGISLIQMFTKKSVRLRTIKFFKDQVIDVSSSYT